MICRGANGERLRQMRRNWVMGSATSRRALVVEDNADCADTLAVLLALLGFDPVVARDGLEAVGIADHLHPDVVFLDLVLLRMHGYDVCRHIRASNWGKNAAVIAVTGLGQRVDRERSSDA